MPDCPTVYPNPIPPPPPGECQLVNDTCKFIDSSLKCNASIDVYNGNKCVPVTDPEYAASVKRNGLSAQAKGFHHQISSACQSTTAVSGTIHVSLGRDCLPMAIYVALLMNTMHFSTDHHLLSLLNHCLGRLYKTLTPLASVPLGMTTVVGMVSGIPCSCYKLA